MLLRPRPGTSQKVIDAKTALFSFILDDCKFKNHVKWGLETMALFGTGIFKWGYDWKAIETFKREATVRHIDTPNPDGSSTRTSVPTDEPPKITRTEKIVPLPFFEHRRPDLVLVDPALACSDIREAGWVVDVRFMDWYQFMDLKNAVVGAQEDGEDGTVINGWKFPSDAAIKSIWEVGNLKSHYTDAEQYTYARGVVHHAEDENVTSSPAP